MERDGKERFKTIHGQLLGLRSIRYRMLNRMVSQAKLISLRNFSSLRKDHMLICIVDITLFNNRQCLGMTAEEGSTALEPPEGSEVKKVRLNPESDNVSSILVCYCVVLYGFCSHAFLEILTLSHRSMLLIYQVDIIFRPISNSSRSAFAR